MQIVVGLGNPGKQYAGTKHNIGFWVVDNLATRLLEVHFRFKWQADVAECYLGTTRLLLVKPQTYMNLSGEAVAQVVNFYKANPAQDLIVVYDDMDFPVGNIKLRQQGSAGGHNGLKSIIARVGTEQFARVRVGIGRPLAGRAPMEHVLSPFPAEQRTVVQGAVGKAVEAIEFALEQGFAMAMNRFNGNS
ncbi:aminoacyl-tRNA hydrolase [Alicyclobacillaceae bacterium I2511]|nr:aminoacyl-tRNA hydrolase [Alicyclobacillaceae bacterium I2511]